MEPDIRAARARPKREAIRFSHEAGVTGPKSFQSCPLRPGLVLAFSRPTRENPLNGSFDMDDAPIQFGFTYAGQNRCAYSGGRLRNQVHETRPGSNGIFYLPKTHGTIEQPAHNPTCIMGVIAAPELLLGYFAEHMDQLPRAFRRNLEGRKDAPMTWFGTYTPAKHALLHQILECPYAGGLRKLYLESRVMELLTLQVYDYIESETRDRPRTPPLAPADVERVRHARELLVNDLENPPGLPELAVLAGINEKKLKLGFRQVFGTSVFGYLREHRLHKAHELLRQGGCNVTEAAYAVGYQNLSHFSRVFRERFGILPREFLLNQRSLLSP